MKILLEDMVIFDMIAAGYDPLDQLDIEAFWDARLS